METYPNPCSDSLTIRTGDDASTRVRIFSDSGKSVYDTTQQIGAFNTLTIDMSGMAPGKYVVRVEISGEDAVDKQVVKI